MFPTHTPLKSLPHLSKVHVILTWNLSGVNSANSGAAQWWRVRQAGDCYFGGHTDLSQLSNGQEAQGGHCGWHCCKELSSSLAPLPFFFYYTLTHLSRCLSFFRGFLFSLFQSRCLNLQELKWNEMRLIPSLCLLICRVNGITDETPANVSNVFVLHTSWFKIFMNIQETIAMLRNKGLLRLSKHTKFLLRNVCQSFVLLPLEVFLGEAFLEAFPS